MYSLFLMNFIWSKRKIFRPAICMICAIFVLQKDTINVQISPFELFNKAHVIIQSGDLIFRRVDSGGGQFVLLTDTKSEYSHVGIIWQVEDRSFVIHVTPSVGLSANYVEMIPMEEFIEPASTIAVYRLKGDRDKIAQSAAENGYKSINKVSFDLDFDLATDEEQYCTEFIWKIYKKAGMDLIDNQFDAVHFAFLQTDQVILVSRLLNSKWLIPIYP